MSNDARSLLSAAGFDAPKIVTILDVDPDPVVGFEVDGDPFEVWEQLSQLRERTGLYPVVMTDVELIQDAAPEMPSPKESLQAAAKIDVRRWLKRNQEDGSAELGDWPDDAEPIEEFSATSDALSGEQRSDIKIALLPIREPWEAAAHLRYCSPNYDIEPQHHVAIHRHWFDRYGAELVTATGDILEFRVARPPTTREAAMQLAREQYAYCPDIVEQGVETLSNLAAILMNGGIWYFWWD